MQTDFKINLIVVWWGFIRGKIHVCFTRVIGWEGRAGKIDLEIGKEILADRANFTAKYTREYW